MPKATELRPALSFNVDWFSEHAPWWSMHLGSFAGRASSAMVIGAYEGMSCVWLLEHVLTHPGSRLVVLDDMQHDSCVGWRGAAVFNPGVEGTLRRNLAPYGSKVRLMTEREPHTTLIDMRSTKAGARPRLKPSTSMTLYDIIVIDAQGSRHALDTAVLAWPLLAPEGVMVWTNYTHNKEHDTACPRKGIDAFIEIYAPYLTVLRTAFHTFVRRRGVPLDIRDCHSEHFPEPGPEFPDCGGQRYTSRTRMTAHRNRTTK
jgi:hypothetical protein